VTFQVLTAASIFVLKMTILWNVAPYILVVVSDVSEVLTASEMSVNFYQTTRRNITENSHL
jgi:hypothetical protein